MNKELPNIVFKESFDIIDFLYQQKRVLNNINCLELNGETNYSLFFNVEDKYHELLSIKQLIYF